MSSKRERGAHPSAPSSEEVAKLAYALWQTRGELDGSAEDDWFEAERQLRRGVAA